MVMESPVCTPMASRFSIEQMMMALSALSRTTSISNSFQPSTDSSISTSRVGEASSPASTMEKKFLAVISDAAAGAAHGEAGADHGGKPHLVQHRKCLAETFRRQFGDGIAAAVKHEISGRIAFFAELALEGDALGHFQPDGDHRLLEAFAVLGLVDGVGGGADQLDIVARQRADLAQRERGVGGRSARPWWGKSANTRPGGTLGRSRAMIFSTNSGVMGSI